MWGRLTPVQVANCLPVRVIESRIEQGSGFRVWGLGFRVWGELSLGLPCSG